MDITGLPPPTARFQHNCWTAAVREFDKEGGKYQIVLVPSRRARILKDGWYSRILKPIGRAITRVSWVVFAAGWLLQGKKFAHIILTCKPQRCAISYEPPANSPSRSIPPLFFKGKWKAWRKDCECIKGLMFPKDHP